MGYLGPQNLTRLFRLFMIKYMQMKKTKRAVKKVIGTKAKIKDRSKSVAKVVKNKKSVSVKNKKSATVTVSTKKVLKTKVTKKETSPSTDLKPIFENENMFVFSKPSGMSVHKDGKREEYTFSDFLLKNYKNLKGVGENILTFHDGQEFIIEKPGIVHRLDKDTTGALVVAKNQDSYINLKNQFQNHKVKKEYIALVYGDVRHDTGIIDASIARNKNDFRKKEIVRVSGDGLMHRGEEREALTRYRVIKRLEIGGTRLTLVAFYPETGRTHQIRIHAKSIGHPIVGDYLYGHKNEKLEKEIFGKQKVRQLLHAKSITLHNPHTGELLKIEAEYPKDYKKFI